MLKKLSLDLRSRALPLLNNIEAAKTLFFAFLLLWLISSRSFWSAVFYLAGSLYLYFSASSDREIEGNSKKLLASFLIIVIAPFFWAPHISGSFFNFFYLFFYLLIWSAFFFIVLGIKNNIFKNSRLIYGALNNFLLFFLLIFLFSIDRSQFFLVKYVSFFTITFLLIREFLILEFEKLKRAKLNLFAAIFSILIFQFAWGSMFLPIGFLNSAALMLVIVLMIKDSIIAYFRKILDRQLIMKNITIILIFGLIIFVASRWQP
ncbi:hypothetical protein HZC33_02230 [Candidatus Wolfebacteria bacterium]|nr:hypothetical protein [Candidatus Wolfebacteria bacterium]